MTNEILRRICQKRWKIISTFLVFLLILSFQNNFTTDEITKSVPNLVGGLLGSLFGSYLVVCFFYWFFDGFFKHHDAKMLLVGSILLTLIEMGISLGQIEVLYSVIYFTFLIRIFFFLAALGVYFYEKKTSKVTKILFFSSILSNGIASFISFITMDVSSNLFSFFFIVGLILFFVSAITHYLYINHQNV